MSQEFYEDGLPAIIDNKGELRRLGSLQPPAGFVSAFPVFEDAVRPLSMSEIEQQAKSGQMDGRKLFDGSYIQNQKHFGSCNGFAQAAALTRARVRRRLPKVILSGAYAYSLINGGRDRGSMLDDGLRECERSGIAPADVVGWDKIYPHLYDKKKADALASEYRAFEPYAVKTQMGLWTALALGWDVVVAVHAGDAFMRLDRNGIAGPGNGPGNHAVMCDGLVWAGGTLAGTGVNSWGTEYGDEGRMLLTWDAHFRTTFGNHVFYAIRSSTDDKFSDGPPAA